MDPTKPNLVPENLLKKKHSLDTLALRKSAQEEGRGNRKVFKKTKTPATKYRNPEKFIVQSRGKRNTKARYDRVLKKGMQSKKKSKKDGSSEMETRVIGEISTSDNSNNSNSEADANANANAMAVTETFAVNSSGAKFVIVVRRRGDNAVPAAVKKVLSTLRLRGENEAVFVRYNSANAKQLDLVEPYIAYGPPSKKLVMELVTRRGFGKIDGERVPLTGNSVVEDALGEETGVICLEDVVEEIFGVGEHFGVVNSFLWPFKLTAPKSSFLKRSLNYQDGKGDVGDWGGKVDDLIQVML